MDIKCEMELEDDTSSGWHLEQFPFVEIQENVCYPNINVKSEIEMKEESLDNMEEDTPNEQFLSNQTALISEIFNENLRKKRGRKSTDVVPRKHKSLAWKFFKTDDTDERKAICDLCKVKISRGLKMGTYTTTNMLKHLLTKHEKEFKDEEENNKIELEKESKREIPSSSSSSSSPAKKLKVIGCSTPQKLPYSINKQNNYGTNDHESKKIDNLIGEMIAVDIKPISFVEDIGFKRLLNHICPNYIIPSSKYMKETVIKNIYNCIREKIQNEIDEAQFLSFASDGWTSSISNTSFIIFTAYWINRTDYKQRSAVLRVSPFIESPTSYNISESILMFMKDFKISLSKVHLLVRDNTPNIVSGVSQAGFQALPCFLHTLRLVLNDVIFEQRYVKDLLEVSKQIISHFNHTPSSFSKYEKYKSKFGIPKNKFIQGVATQENGQYNILHRILEQKMALISYCSDYSEPIGLETNQWLILEKLVKILNLFNESTQILSKKEATASEIIPNIRVLFEFFHKAQKADLFNGLGSTLSTWNVSVKTQLNPYLNNKNLILATYLDPRFKNKFLQDQYDGKPTEEFLIQWICEDVYKINQNKCLITDSPSSSQNFEDNLCEFSFETCFNELIQEAQKVQKKSQSKTSTQNVEKNILKSEEEKAMENYADVVKEEMKQYNILKPIDYSESPFLWWFTYKDSFKSLVMVFFKYLSVPSSSIESERHLSTDGTAYSPKRNKISGEIDEVMMFLHFNLRLFNFQYKSTDKV